MALHAELLDTAEALEQHRHAWDALAVARGRPYCAPGWMLSWLRAVAPGGTRVHAVAVRDDHELVGIAPFWAREEGGVWRYGLLAAGVSSPVEPLALAGREPEAAGAIGGLLSTVRRPPGELELRSTPAGSPWPELLAREWPGPAASVARTRTLPVPKISLRHESADAWLATKSRNLRQQMRRGWRRLEAAGARLRLSEPAEVDRDIDSLARLHRARWEAKGGSRALNPDVEAMLKLAARELGPGRLRVLSIDIEDRPISSHLFVAAGRVCAYWLGGFDDRWGAWWPSMQVLVAAVAHGIERGEEWLELGPGGQDYKYRLSDTEDAVERLTIAPASA